MRFLILPLLLLMTGCAGKSGGEMTPRPADSAGSTAADGATAQVPSAPGTAPDTASVVRPDRMTDTVGVGAEARSSRMKLIGEGLPFTTYYPEDDFIMEQNASDEGVGLRFVGNFGGNRNDSISAHFFFPSVTASLSEMNDYVTGEKGAAAAAEWQLTGPATTNCPWSSVSYLYTDTRQPGTGGAICIGQHRGSAFYLITHYPAEHAAALETRVTRILSHLRWKDDGRGLVRE